MNNFPDAYTQTKTISTKTQPNIIQEQTTKFEKINKIKTHTFNRITKPDPNLTIQPQNETTIKTRCISNSNIKIKHCFPSYRFNSPHNTKNRITEKIRTFQFQIEKSLNKRKTQNKKGQTSTV